MYARLIYYVRDHADLSPIANCAALWHVLQRRPYYNTPACPDFVIFTAGAGTTISARIHYVSSSDHKGYVLVEGPDAPSHYKAYQRLLEMTDKILIEKSEHDMFWVSGMQAVKATGGGTYAIRKK